MQYLIKRKMPDMINFSRKWFDLKLEIRNLFRKQYKAGKYLHERFYEEEK